MTKIQDRIKKLIALSSSPSESEAASALAKARELLSKHGLTSEDITAETSDIREISIEAAGKISPWEEKLLQCILSATYTEALRIYREDTEEMLIIGREANCVTAEILYEYLHETIYRKGKIFTESIDDLESFRIGMVDSIKRKFQKQKQELKSRKARSSKKMLIILDKERRKENRQYINEHYGDVNESSTWYGLDENSYGLGKSIGSKISINRQISPEKNGKN